MLHLVLDIIRTFLLVYLYGKIWYFQFLEVHVDTKLAAGLDDA